MKLFILHGWAYNTRETWAPLLALLTARDINYEFLLIPGLTDGTDPVWTLDDYVAWLKNKTEGYEKFALYGHSNGGRISIAFAAKYPEKVARLILEDSAGIPPRGLRRIKRDLLRSLSKLGHVLTGSEHLRTFVHKLIRENDYRNATPNMRKTLANLVAVDLTPDLGTIQAPTLIIWGKKDNTTPLWIGNVIHEGIQGSRMHIIQDARHSPHITHPEVLAGLVAKELAS